MTGSVNSGGLVHNRVSKTAGYTVSTDDYCVVFDGLSGNAILSLPDISSTPLPSGQTYVIINLDHQYTIQVSPAAGDTFNFREQNDIFLVSGASLKVMSDGTSTWHILSRQRPIDVAFEVFDADTYVAVGDGVVAWTCPYSMSGMVLCDAIASVHDKGGSSGATTIMVTRRTNASDINMLATGITIGYNEYYARDGVLSATMGARIITYGCRIYIDVDGVPSGGVPKGLSVTLSFIDFDDT